MLYSSSVYVVWNMHRIIIKGGGMVHSVLKNCLKGMRFLAGGLFILSLLLCIIPLATAYAPGGACITHPQKSLNPLVADASSDADVDGFSNYQEYPAPGNPLRVLSAPIEIRDTIPQDDAGIVNFARVPDQTAVAVLIRAAYGIDLNAPTAVRFRVDDGYHQPYWRDLSHDATRIVKLNKTPDAQATYLWAAYDRFLEPFMPISYLPNAVIQVTVTIRDIRNNFFQSAPIEFKIESRAYKAAARQNVPNTTEFHAHESSIGGSIDTGIAVVDGKLAGAKLFYSSLEPLTPEFGNPDEMPPIDRGDMQAAGVPVNLLPHTVFDRPVSLYIPVTDEIDIRTVGLAYYDGTRWLPAADAEGNVLPGGEGWMVAGSRINHEESSPPLIEVQVYHFSATQAVIFAKFGDTNKEDKRSHDSNANVFISCFINSVTGEPSLGFTELIGLIGFFGFWLLVLRLRSSAFNSFSLR